MLFTKNLIIAAAICIGSFASAAPTANAESDRLLRRQNECYTQDDCLASQVCPIQADMPGPFQCTPASKKRSTLVRRNDCFTQDECPAGQICPIQADMPGPFQCTPESK